MTDPVNLDNLHEITGGDPSLEKELFGIYIASSENCLTFLRTSQSAGAEESWRSQAHSWKGMSFNLGAEALGNLCAKAQMNHMAPPEEKAAMLAAMEAEYAKVKDFLNEQPSS